MSLGRGYEAGLEAKDEGGKPPVLLLGSIKHKTPTPREAEPALCLVSCCLVSWRLVSWLKVLVSWRLVLPGCS